MFPFSLGWTEIPQTTPRWIENPAHHNPAQARLFWHVQKGANAATGSTPVSNSPTPSPAFPQAGTDRDENIPCWRASLQLPRALPASHSQPCMHGAPKSCSPWALSAGTHPAGSQLNAPSPMPSPGCVCLNPHVCLFKSSGTRHAVHPDVSMVTCSRWQLGVTELRALHHPPPICPRPPSPLPSLVPLLPAPEQQRGEEKPRFSPGTRYYVNNSAGSADDRARMQISFLIPREKRHSRSAPRQS